MSLQHGSRFIIDGLIFHLDHKNPRCVNGSTSCTDLIGNKTGNFAGNAQVTENGFNFSTDGDWIYFSNNDLQLTENITLNCWAKNSNNSGTQTLIRNRHGNESRYLLATNEDEFLWQSWTSTGARATRQTSSANWNINQWNNFCISFQTIYSGRNNLYFYLNGELIHEGELNYVLGESSYPLFIGGGYNGAGAPVNQFYGDIAIASIYNKPLTAKQVRQNYNSVKSRFSL